jgi:ABC-type amino acid transport substrate-binding protein
LVLCGLLQASPKCQGTESSVPKADSTTTTANIEIRYPAVTNNPRHDFDPYCIALLKLGMEKSGRRYTITPYRLATFVESRSEISLARNDYNLHWLNSNAQREASLVAIRIPLFKGLIGWRLLFIKAQNQQQFNQVNSLEDLRQYTAGQGHDWPDVDIFKFNDLPLVTSANWIGLFKMLQAGRIDYYPRSLIEIWQEQQQFPTMDLHIEDHLALRYPAAYYFFTNRQSPALAQALTEGLQRAIADCSFEQLFLQFYGDYIDKAALDKRKIIDLDNPELEIENSGNWYLPAMPPMK